MIISERIRKIRVIKGLSPRQLAQLTNLSPATISRLEANHRNPGTDTLQRLAAAFEVTVSFLLGEEEDQLEIAVALKRQSLRRLQRTITLTDSQRLRLEQMCFLDSAPASVHEWKAFLDNLIFFEAQS